jgi:hypothetical protein
MLSVDLNEYVFGAAFERGQMRFAWFIGVAYLPNAAPEWQARIECQSKML